MHGRKLFSTGPVATILTVVALIGGCREASTGPSDPNNSAFASSMQLVSGNSQVGQIGSTLSQLLTVKVMDAGGLPVQGASVTFAARTGGGAIVPPSGTSNAAGLVTATWTLGTTLGAQTAVAKLTNSFVNDSSNFTATATPGAGTGFAIVSGNNQTAHVGHALALPLVVKVTDSFGNNISGITVTWVAGALSGSVTPATDTTSADGSAHTTWTLGNTVTTQTVSASITGVGPQVFSAVATPDTGRIVTIVSGNSQVASITSALTALSVRVTDQFGNPIVGDSVTWTDSLMGGGKVSATRTGTDATGIARTTWTLGARAGTQFLRAREASNGLTAGFTATATVAFSDVESGNFQTCGIAALNNDVYCWGLGDAGQLGKGVVSDAAQATVPVPFNGDTLVGPFLQVRQLFPARGYMCALTSARQMYCWGHVIGGAGATLAAAFTNITDNSNTVIPNFLANGEEHQCVLTLSGEGVCTGFGRQGQIGDNTGLTTTPNAYNLIATSPLDPGAPTVYSSMSAGRSFTCGMGRYNNSLLSQIPWCWGFNGSGQMGDGLFVNSLQPTKVTMPAGATAFDSSTVSAGGQHACAIEASTSTTPGNAWCWGSNGFGQLGNGSVIPPAGGVERDSIPQAVVMPGVAFMKMYAGEYHSCALTVAGVAYCWGRNDLAQLGTGAVSAPVSTPTAVVGGLTFKSLTLGELFTCGVLGVPTASNAPSQAASTIYCWGDNLYGQIGTTGQASGGATPTPVPTAVKGQPGHP